MNNLIELNRVALLLAPAEQGRIGIVTTLPEYHAIEIGEAFGQGTGTELQLSLGVLYEG